MFALPHELIATILKFTSSKDRTITSSVSKIFLLISIEVSKELSPFPELYLLKKEITEEDIKKISKKPDYHLISRLKVKISLKDCCKTGDIDLAALMIEKGVDDGISGFMEACYFWSYRIGQVNE